MKTIRLIAAFVFVTISYDNYAQVGIGTTSPKASALLDLDSKTKGLLPPRMSSSEMLAISNPEAGLVVYNTDANSLHFFNGASWINMSTQSPVTACTVKISATEYKSFLCHNLGADTSLDPHTATTFGINGAYIQWGKRGPNTTGNAAVDWITAGNDGPNGFGAAPTNTDDNAATITDWSTALTTDDAAWNSGTETAPIKTANDPCPTGFRVPTLTEWFRVKTYNNDITLTGTPWSEVVSNYGSAFHFDDPSGNHLLTLPTAGKRDIDGSFKLRGLKGFYWSSSSKVANTSSFSVYFDEGYNTMASSSNRKSGFSVRCIAE